MRLAILLTAVVFALVLVGRAEQNTGSRPAPASLGPPVLPPLQQTCPMHPDVVEDKPGTCPLCRMALVPVRLETVWSCPFHAAVTRTAKGTCPICGRELVQMTMALTWTCRNRADIDVLEPGRCPDGSAMIAKRTLRPHGNHNPQHGGQFFMAPDNTHHLEGAMPNARLFRLYVYDDYARPLPIARLKAIDARMEIGGRAMPLTASATGSYLQGRIDAIAFPARVTAKVRLKHDAPEYRFDFAFPGVTKDPNDRTLAARPPATPVPPVPDGAPDPALIQVPIPATVPDILAQLRIRDTQVRTLLERGNLPAVFVPAFQARDLALALEARLSEVPATRREAAGAGIQQLVRAAWLLDAFGDVGNAVQARDAYVPFHEAALQIAGAFGTGR